MLIELVEKKLPEILKIGEEAAARANAIGLKTDWQKEREAFSPAAPKP